MEYLTECQICGKKISSDFCVKCGRNVCEDHYDQKTKLCSQCRP